MMSGEKRLMMASSLFKDKALGEDKKKLGTLVNIIFDKKCLEARMLIFPDEQTKWLIMKLLESGKELTGEIIKGLQLPFADKTDQIIKDMLEKGGEEAFRIAGEYLTEMKEKLKKMYYLVPSLEIVDARNEVITLERSSECYEGECINMCTCDDDIAFYDVGAIMDVTSLYPITLNLVSIRGLKVSDPEGKTGRIMNLQLDIEEGIISNLVIQTIGKGAGKCLVNPMDFDFSTLTSKSKFEEHPTLASSNL